MIFLKFFIGAFILSGVVMIISGFFISDKNAKELLFIIGVSFVITSPSGHFMSRPSRIMHET